MADALRVGFATMWSAAIWVSVLVFLVENRNFSLDGLRLLVLPQAALTIVLHLFFPGNLIPLYGKTAMFPWHVGIALLAYSTLSIAAIHALVMYVQDKHLHRMRGNSQQTWLTLALDRLPALLKMESLLFILVTVGFCFADADGLIRRCLLRTGSWCRLLLDHKLSPLFVLALVRDFVSRTSVAWMAWQSGPSHDLVWLLILLLAYVGSRFVLEVLCIGAGMRILMWLALVCWCCLPCESKPNALNRLRAITNKHQNGKRDDGRLHGLFGVYPRI